MNETKYKSLSAKSVLHKIKKRHPDSYRDDVFYFMNSIQLNLFFNSVHPIVFVFTNTIFQIYNRLI
jgi:hypothetical protein